MMNMEFGSLFAQGYVFMFRIIFTRKHVAMGIKIVGATFFTGFSIGCVGKQCIYDFQHKSFPFRKMTLQIRL